MLLFAGVHLHPSWDGMCGATLAAPAWGQPGRSWQSGKVAWRIAGAFPMATGGNGWIAVARDIPAAIPCQHPSESRWGISHLWLSVLRSGCSWFVVGTMGAVCVLWVPLEKSRCGLKSLELGKDTWLLPGSSCLKGSPLTLPAPQAPSSLAALSTGCSACCTAKRRVSVCLGQHPAPTPGSGASGMFGEEGGSQSRLEGG